MIFEFLSEFLLISEFLLNGEFFNEVLNGEFVNVQGDRRRGVLEHNSIGLI